MWSFSDKTLCIDVTPKFRARNDYNEYGDGNNLDNASNFKIVLVYNLKYCYERDNNNNKKRTVKKKYLSLTNKIRLILYERTRAKFYTN